MPSEALWEKNPRKIDDIASSGGIKKPILLHAKRGKLDSYQIMDGHHRFMAAAKRGDKEIFARITYGHMDKVDRQTKLALKLDSKGFNKLAIKHYGLTDNPSEAGFILPEGKMLDFSGRFQRMGDTFIPKDGKDRRVSLRATDHSDVGRILSQTALKDLDSDDLDAIFTPGRNYRNIERFKKASGSVRLNMSPFRGKYDIDIDIRKDTPITSSQERLLRKIEKEYKPEEIHYEVTHEKRLPDYSYSKGTASNMKEALQNIKRVQAHKEDVPLPETVFFPEFKKQVNWDLEAYGPAAYYKMMTPNEYFEATEFFKGEHMRSEQLATYRDIDEDARKPIQRLTWKMESGTKIIPPYIAHIKPGGFKGILQEGWHRNYAALKLHGDIPIPILTNPPPEYYSDDVMDKFAKKLGLKNKGYIEEWRGRIKEARIGIESHDDEFRQAYADVIKEKGLRLRPPELDHVTPKQQLALDDMRSKGDAAIQDKDGDGVIDQLDCEPNDPNKHTTWNVHYVGSSTLKDYAGMNYYAGKAMHFHPLPDKHTILVDKHLHALEKKRTILHEEVESTLMSHGMSYWKAHKIALKAEKQIK
jgi:hypothetical protein